MSGVKMRPLSATFLLVLLQVSAIAAQDNIDYPVTIDRPSVVYLTQEATITVDFGSTPIESGNCVFLSPDEREFEVAVTAETSACTYQIPTVTQADIGQWTCSINEGNEEGLFHRYSEQLIRHYQLQIYFACYALPSRASFNLLLSDEYVKDVRLPTHIVPMEYDVEMIPFIVEDNFTIAGSMQLEFFYREDQIGSDMDLKREIKLHRNYIAIHEASVVIQNVATGDKVGIAGHEYDLEREMYIIHLTEDLADLNIYNLTITYTGWLNDILVGFYRCEVQYEASPMLVRAYPNTCQIFIGVATRTQRTA